MKASDSFDHARLADPGQYRFWQDEHVRFADLDPVGHANNNAIGAYFENARVGLLTAAGVYAHLPGQVVVLRRTVFEFLGEIHYPSPLRVGLGVIALGTSSIRVAGALFVNETIVATHDATQVLIDRETRRPTPIPDAARAVLEPYQL